MKSAAVVWLSLALIGAASSAAAVTLSCPPASGPAGGEVAVQFAVDGEGDAVVATQNDLGFDAAILSLAEPEGTSPNCAINPAIGAGTEPDKLLSVGFLNLDLARSLVLSQTNALPIPDGLLYTCTFQIDADAPRAATTISNSGFIASDAEGVRLPATAVDCAVTVTDPPPTPTPPGFCREDEDCPEGQVCVDNRCVTPTPVGYCEDDEDCPEEEECIDNRCRPRATATPTPSPTPIGFCEDEEDCPPGQICVDNRCATPVATPTPIGFCNSDDDCPEGEECVDNQCQPRDSGGGGGCNCSIDSPAPERAALNLLAALLPVALLLKRKRSAATARRR